MYIRGACLCYPFSEDSATCAPVDILLNELLITPLVKSLHDIAHELPAANLLCHLSDSFLTFHTANLWCSPFSHVFNCFNHCSYQSKDSGRWDGPKDTARTAWLSGNIIYSSSHGCSRGSKTRPC